MRNLLSALHRSASVGLWQLITDANIAKERLINKVSFVCLVRPQLRREISGSRTYSREGPTGL